MIWRATSIGLLLAVCSSVVSAQEHEVAFNPIFAEGCLAEAGNEAERAGCIGEAAKICIEETSESPLTVTRALCAIREREFWDRRIKTRVMQLRQAFEVSDAELEIDNTTPYPKGMALLELQAIWPSYRDQTCKFETALWGWGASSGLVEVECLMRVTAEHALYLEQQPDGDF